MDRQVIAVYMCVHELYTVGGCVGMVQLFCSCSVERLFSVQLFRCSVVACARFGLSVCLFICEI